MTGLERKTEQAAVAKTWVFLNISHLQQSFSRVGHSPVVLAAADSKDEMIETRGDVAKDEMVQAARYLSDGLSQGNEITQHIREPGEITSWRDAAGWAGRH